MFSAVIGIVEQTRSALAHMFGKRENRRIRRFWWVMFWCWLATVFTLSSLSPAQLDSAMLPLLGWDKALHFIAFAAGATVLAIALHLSTSLPWHRVVVITVLVVSLYGALDEYHQLYTPSRSGGDVGDWTADTLGAICAALAVRWFYVRRHKEDRAAPARD